MNTRIALSAIALMFSTSAFATPFFAIWNDNVSPPPFGRFAKNDDTCAVTVSGGVTKAIWKIRIAFSDYSNPSKADVSMALSDDLPISNCKDFGNINNGNRIGLSATGIAAIPKTVIFSSYSCNVGSVSCYYYVRSIGMNGLVNWTKRYIEPDASGWKIVGKQSGVGDFLSIGDGADELQVVRGQANADGSKANRYDYFNILTGALISTKTISVAKP